MTLVEVIVSVVILGLVVAGVFATLSVVGRGTAGKSGTLDIRGLNYARDTLERLKNAVSTDPARSLPLVPSSEPYDDTDSLPQDFKDLGGTRTYLVEGIDANQDGAFDYKRVTVTVKWPD